MKNVLFLSITFNILLVVLLILSINNTSDITEENIELFEYVDAHKAYSESKNDFNTYTKNYDDLKKYKSDYYYRLQKAEERYKIIQETIHNKYY